MNKILDILDSMEMTRLKAEKKPEDFTVDSVIMEFSNCWPELPATKAEGNGFGVLEKIGKLIFTAK